MTFSPFLLIWKPEPKTDFSNSGFASLRCNYLSQQIRNWLSLALPSLFKNSVSHDKWSDLPTDLLDMIFNRLGRSIGDLLRVSAVCKSWHLVANSIRQQQAGPFILLHRRTMTTTNDHLEEVHYVHDFSKSESQKIFLLETRGEQIINSWNEWLVTLKGSFDNYDHICAFNLLTKAQVKLPPTPTTYRRLWIDKVNVSSTPSDPNCVFMAICTYDKKLAFCKQGEKEWKILKSESDDRYRDIVYFKGDFYAVAEGGNLVVCDIDGPEPKVVNVAPSIPEELANEWYLVESSGDLFQVIKLKWVENYDRSCMVLLYKLNLSERMWQKVDSLGDNSALFVGHNVSMSISAKDFPVKKDHIFFTEFWLGANGSEYIKAFDLKIKKVDAYIWVL